MNQTILKAVSQVVEAVVVKKAHSASKYLSPKLVVRATRPLVRRSQGRMVPSGKNVSLVLTIAGPNHAHRKVIRKFKKSGGTFPIKPVLLTYPPRPRR